MVHREPKDKNSQTVAQRLIFSSLSFFCFLPNLASGVDCRATEFGPVARREFFSGLTELILTGSGTIEKVHREWAISQKLNATSWIELERCLQFATDASCYSHWSHLTVQIQGLIQDVRLYANCEVPGSLKSAVLSERIESLLTDLKSFSKGLSSQVLARLAEQKVIQDTNSFLSARLGRGPSLSTSRQCRLLAVRVLNTFATQMTDRALAEDGAELGVLGMNDLALAVANLNDCSLDEFSDQMYKDRDARDLINEWLESECNELQGPRRALACSWKGNQRVPGQEEAFTTGWFPGLSELFDSEKLFRHLRGFHSFAIASEKRQVSGFALLIEIATSRPLWPLTRIVDEVALDLTESMALDELSRTLLRCRFKRNLNQLGLKLEDPSRDCQMIDALVSVFRSRNQEVNDERLLFSIAERAPKINLAVEIQSLIDGSKSSLLISHPLPFLFSSRSEAKKSMPRSVLDSKDWQALLDWVRSGPLSEAESFDLFTALHRAVPQQLDCAFLVSKLERLFQRTFNSQECLTSSRPHFWSFLGFQFGLTARDLAGFAHPAHMTFKMEPIEISRFHSARMWVSILSLMDRAGIAFATADQEELGVGARLSSLSQAFYDQLEEEKSGYKIKVVSLDPNDQDRVQSWVDEIERSLQ